MPAESIEATEAAPAVQPTAEPINSTLTSTDGGAGGVSLTDGATDAPVTPAAPTGIVFPENWKEGVDAELRNDPSMQHILDVPTLAKSYVHARKQIGADKIAIPGKHATEQDWMSVYTKLGLPSSLETYDVEIPSETFDETTINVIKEHAHKAGILPNQLNQLLAGYAAAVDTAGEEATKQQELEQVKQIDGLRKEWGMAFEQNVAEAKSAVKFLNDAAFNEWLDKTGMGNNPTMIKVFNKFGQLLKEDSIKGQPENVGGALSPANAKSELQKIHGNLDHPFYKKEHINHQNAVDEVNQLSHMAYPNEEAAPIIKF